MAFDVDHLQKPIDKLIKSSRSSSKIDAPEYVHKLRTTTRRVEAILQALDLPKSHQKTLLKELKKIRKAAGKVRDMDVLTAKAADVNVSEERDCQVHLLSHLGAKRQQKAAALKSALKDRGAHIRRELKRFAKQVAPLQGAAASNRKGQAEAEANAAARALELSGELQKFAPLGRRNLHAYRITGKQLRYVLQMAQPRDDAILKRLRTMQDAVGEWHDWEELHRIAKKVLHHQRNCGLLRELQLHADASFDAALRVANDARKRFVKSEKNRPSRMTQASAKLVA